MTQGDPLSPTIFNVVVDTVVRHWVHGFMEEAEARGETGREGRHQAALFYANNGMVVSSDPAWLQGAFTALVGLFDRVDLQTNAGKTVSMVCHPCQVTAGNITQEAYGRRLTGEGKSYTERQREWMECAECGEQLAVGSMSSHIMTRHGKAEGQRRQWKPQKETGAQIYRMSLPTKGGPQQCPVEGCPGTLETRTAMRVHFVHRHVQDTAVMLEEGNPPHLRCARCDMQVPRKALNGRHLGTAQCAKGVERKRRRLAETEKRENSERAFRAYGQKMEAVTDFRYLGWLLTATDDDWLAVAGNIKKAQRSWRRMAKVLGREGEDPKVSGTFYIAVTQQVLLFGAETWVLTAKMKKALDAFQGREARKLTGRHPQRGRDGEWYYPSLAGAMKEAGIVWIRTLILRRQNTVAQFIATRPILDLCEKSNIRPGAQVTRRWWEQTGIDWKGSRERADASVEAADPGTKALTDSKSGADDATDRTVRGTGEEASLGASGSSGAEKT